MQELMQSLTHKKNTQKNTLNFPTGPWFSSTLEKKKKKKDELK